MKNEGVSSRSDVSQKTSPGEEIMTVVVISYPLAVYVCTFWSATIYMHILHMEVAKMAQGGDSHIGMLRAQTTTCMDAIVMSVFCMPP
jgi:hypothetical protein